MDPEIKAELSKLTRATATPNPPCTEDTMKETAETTSIRLPPSLRAQAEALAKHHGVTLGKFIREALTRHVKRVKRKIPVSCASSITDET